MQFLEPQPIAMFIKKKLEHPRIKPILDGWSIDNDELLELLIHHFEDMGCYMADPNAESALSDCLVSFLKYSPEIILKVSEAERREKMIARSRNNNPE